MTAIRYSCIERDCDWHFDRLLDYTTVDEVELILARHIVETHMLRSTTDVTEGAPLR